MYVYIYIWINISYLLGILDSEPLVTECVTKFSF